MERVKQHISSILRSPEYLLDTPRNIITRKAAKEIIESMEDGTNEELFSKFACELVKIIEGCFCSLGKRGVREKVLSRFHRCTFEGLDKHWESLYKQLQKQVQKDRMLQQFTNQKLFDEMFVSHFSSTTSAPDSTL